MAAPSQTPRADNNAVAEWPAAIGSWYATIILTLAYVLSFMDRQILTLMIEPIQRDLGLTDVQISLVIGAAFALLYATAGLPLGYLVDRANRRLVGAAGVAFWSVMMPVCGLAQGYGMLFVARMGVGIGEATLSPAAYSLLPDLFPPSRLVRAVGVYATGATLGIGLAYIFGGALAQWATSTASIPLPLIGEVASWRAPFFILLVPGIVLAALVLTIREPPRRVTALAQMQDGPAPLLGFLRSHGAAAGLLFLGMGLQSVVVQAILTWTPTLLIRRFGWSSGDIGLVLGVLLLIGGIARALCGARRWPSGVANGQPRRLVRLCLASGAVLLLVAPLAPLQTSGIAVLVVMALGFGIGTFATSPALSALQLMTPNHLRGRMTALFLLVTQLIGMTVGPTLVAVLTQYAFKRPELVGYGQMCTAAVGALGSIIAFALCERAMRRGGMLTEAATTRVAT